MHSRTFLLLQNEGYLLKGCIDSALKTLMVSSSVERGVLYAALFNYSIGLERLLKLSLLLDHCVSNKGTFPTYAEIKSLGHDLITLHKKARPVCDRYQVEIPDNCRCDELDDRLIELLSNFAISGRYFNLDALTGSGKSADPLPVWANLLAEIYERDVPQEKRETDEKEVKELAEQMKETTTYLPGTSLDGRVQSYEEFFSDHGKITLVMPEVVWRFARMLYPFQMLVFELDHPIRSGQAGRPEDFPFMWEFCSFCSEDKQAILAEIARS